METQTYTIEDLRNGKVAVVNDGTVEELDKVVKYAFDWFVKEDESNRYLFKMGVKYGTSNGTDLPTQSVKVFLKEIEQKENKQMGTKELKVGDYFRGFKYDCDEDLEELMDSHVGEIGIIVQKHNSCIKVEFEDKSTWYYPHFLAIEHLVDPLEDTPFHKPDFSHLLDVDKILEKGIKNSGLNDIPIEELEAHFKEEPKLFSILLSKEKDRRIVIDQTKEQIDLLIDASKGWHVIVIEQQQDKGIQIVIKS
jgi:hypothetical protein